MTATDTGTEEMQPVPGRFWFARRIRPHLRVAVLAFLPCPDLIGRFRMRRAARELVTLRTWPGMDATSAQAAQLAMLRLLWLQKQTRRAVRWRHREAAVMLARGSIETLFLGMYCLRVPGAIEKLHAGNIKALNSGLSCLAETGIAPAAVIRECTAALGQAAEKYLVVAEMANAIDKANGDPQKSARGIYDRLYGPLSNFTVHASGGTLMRHVRGNGRVRQRPSRSAARRSPARVADFAAGILAADLARRAGEPPETLIAYASRHEARTLLPMTVMAFAGASGSAGPRRLGHALAEARRMCDYLWRGAAAADTPEVRTAYIREHFEAALAPENLDMPAGALDPFIHHVAGMLARAVAEAGDKNGAP
jgi:hypothetical protein